MLYNKNPYNNQNALDAKGSADLSLEYWSFVTLKIYNLLGKEIEILFEGRKAKGKHKAIWEAKKSPAAYILFNLMPMSLYTRGRNFYKNE